MEHDHHLALGQALAQSAQDAMQSQQLLASLVTPVPPWLRRAVVTKRLLQPADLYLPMNIEEGRYLCTGCSWGLHPTAEHQLCQVRWCLATRIRPAGLLRRRSCTGLYHHRIAKCRCCLPPAKYGACAAPGNPHQGLQQARDLWNWSFIDRSLWL